VTKELKDLVKLEKSSGGKDERCSTPPVHCLLPDNPDFLGDIKNLTTSFIISSISNSLAPTPMPNNFYKSNNANNFLNSFNKSTAQLAAIDDLRVSKYELNIFKDVLVASTTELIPQNTASDAATDHPRLQLIRSTNKKIQFGNYEIETWYKSPYPDDYWQLDKIFICQYCLIYMKSHSVLNRHLEKCLWRHPPGREIYRKDVYSFFEVDGKFNKLYCQNLCLLAKLFLDHKTLYFDVEPFLFYVLTQYDEATGSFQTIGYFSKEKQSLMNYNLSCILILPQYMNKSYGRLLIDFSYLLSRVEGKLGSPERPLSDLGLISYRSYWKSKVLAYLTRHMDDPEISAKEISMETGILSNDIISTLQYIGLIKYWKAKHVILRDKVLFCQQITFDIFLAVLEYS
jgi:histone acetyltransferase MYST2